MTHDSERIDTNPAPQAGRLFPYDAVVGILPDTDQASDTVNVLTARGFQESEITLLSGSDGIAAVDLQGERHGLLGRIFRKLDTIGDEHDESEAHVAALREGRLVLAVQVDNEEEKQRALEAFREHDGHHVNYYSRWTTEHLIP